MKLLVTIMQAIILRQKHPDIDKYRYSGHGLGFDRKASFSIGNEIGKNVIIFGVNISSSSKIDNRKK